MCKTASYIGASALLPSAIPSNIYTGRCVSPSLLVISVWNWFNFSFGQPTVALNRPLWLQRGLPFTSALFTQNIFIEHTPSCVCGLSSAGVIALKPCLSWQCASVSSLCLPLLMWLFCKSQLSILISAANTRRSGTCGYRSSSSPRL